MSGRSHTNRGAPLRQTNDTHHLQQAALLADPRLQHLVRAHQQSTILQDRIAIQHREIQALLLENQRLVGAHVALKDELALAQRDLLRLSALAKDVKAERDAQVREVYEKSLKLDAEVRAIDAMSADLVQVKTDLQKLTLHRQELDRELRFVNDGVAEARREASRVDGVKAEIEALQREIQKGRAAIECEMKNKAINFEQDQIMEKNMILLAQEMEKLRDELANAEKRAAAANPGSGYTGNYGDLGVGYGGMTYHDPYGMQKVEGGSDNCPPFMSEAMPNGPCDIKSANLHQ
ncbi:hypothetical protein Tsubulata_000412 [Turnera subulata]|uniref:Protein FLC EXPRESSOR n=1 Tax=Turnera subulata TaxID=218843 RepID=A0A9Q0FZB0_9ROSI|nr:hypothetical protein Tsubulata_000412 [Turnera subulata]